MELIRTRIILKPFIALFLMNRLEVSNRSKQTTLNDILNSIINGTPPTERILEALLLKTTPSPYSSGEL